MMLRAKPPQNENLRLNIFVYLRASSASNFAHTFVKFHAIWPGWRQVRDKGEESDRWGRRAPGYVAVVIGYTRKGSGCM